MVEYVPGWSDLASRRPMGEELFWLQIVDPHLENAVVLWLGPKKEPAVVFGADLLIIV